ncbi:MAG: Ig-like domain-containing protein [Sideroxyarcus sp.]|nr:Ig-like domain-containing protein [Sideroxyarcus sp.]
MSFRPKLKSVLAAVIMATTGMSAHAALERVGPTSVAPAIGGFPAWYQDTSGLTLEFCDPKNALEVSGGWCLVLPADVPVAPEVFPTSFFDEHFYYAADATMTTPAGANILLVSALESAFATGPAQPGDQVTFTRIRLRMTPVPVTGTYRFIHPYGEDSIEGVAGGRITFTEDIGIGAPGDFSGALVSRVGPFLTASATPGGTELAPVAGPSGLYLADPARLGPVTGSTLPNFIDSSGTSRNHNIFRVEGPVGSNLGGPGIDFIETTDFALVGRVFTGALPGRVDVKRANYSRNAAGRKLFVFANAFPTTQPRIPPAPKPAPVLPQLSFFAAPCAGTVNPVTGAVQPPFSAPAGAIATPMSIVGTDYWGEMIPLTIPPSVCVQDSAATDALGNPVPIFVDKQVTDEVTIGSALYNPITRTLAVAASSSDAVVPPTLTLAFGTQQVNLVAGKASVAPLAAPPSRVTVRSSALGFADSLVSVGAPIGVAPVISTTPLLAATSGLSYAYLVVASDADGGPLTFSLDAAPVGMSIVPATATSVRLSWRPTAVQVGLQDVTVRVTDSTGLFTTQSFRINVVANANRPPVVANDAFTMIKGTTLNVAAPGVLANDSDPDVGNTLTVSNYTVPTVGTLAGQAAGGFTYTPPATFTGMTGFRYLARDNSGLASATAGFVSIAVRANRAPVTVDDAAVTPRNTPTVINVLTNDSDLDTAIDPTNRINPATVFIPAGKRPNQGGTVTVNADGTINYTPRAGFVGIETFSYAVRDTYSTPGISRATTVRVTVQ